MLQRIIYSEAISWLPQYFSNIYGLFLKWRFFCQGRENKSLCQGVNRNIWMLPINNKLLFSSIFSCHVIPMKKTLFSF